MCQMYQEAHGIFDYVPNTEIYDSYQLAVLLIRIGPVAPAIRLPSLELRFSRAEHWGDTVNCQQCKTPFMAFSSSSTQLILRNFQEDWTVCNSNIGFVWPKSGVYLLIHLNRSTYVCAVTITNISMYSVSAWHSQLLIAECRSHIWINVSIGKSCKLVYDSSQL